MKIYRLEAYLYGEETGLGAVVSSARTTVEVSKFNGYYLSEEKAKTEEARLLEAARTLKAAHKFSSAVYPIEVTE